MDIAYPDILILDITNPITERISLGLLEMYSSVIAYSAIKMDITNPTLDRPPVILPET